MLVDDKDKPFPYLLIRNFYDEEELRGIWEELKFFTYKNKLLSPSKTGQTNPLAKKNSGLFLDQVFSDRRYSNILRANRKLFTSQIMKIYADLHFTYENIMQANFDTTLISYYEDTSYYKPHHDQAAITALTWFFKEPKAFTGGDLIFTKFNETIEIENNMLLIFPSVVTHEVTPVQMGSNNTKFSGLGRYCMSQFLNITS